MTKDKEQRLLEAAEKFHESINTNRYNHLAYVVKFAKSKEVGEYWQSQQKETPELEEIRKDLKNQFDYVEDYTLEKLWYFFAPYIKGTDAVEFYRWLTKNTDATRMSEGIWHYENSSNYNIEELYDLFKSLPKAPKEVGGE